MEKFYVIINEEQQGPFSLKELAKHSISKNTLIWEEGMSDWEEAQNIIAVKNLINEVPPPYKKGSTEKSTQATSNKPLSITSPPPIAKPQEKSAKWYKERVLPQRNYNKIALISIGILMLLIIGYSYYNDYKLEKEKIAKKELQLQEDLKVKEAIIHEQQLKEAQRIAEEQKRKEEELKRKREEKLFQLESELEQYKSLRIQAYDKLESIREFDLFRSSSTKARQIREQSDYIASIETEIARLERAIKAHQY